MEKSDWKAPFDLQKTMIEARFAQGETERFWLFVCNVIASIGLLIALAFMQSVLAGVMATVFAAVFLWSLQVDELWARVTAWRRN